MASLLHLGGNSGEQQERETLFVQLLPWLTSSTPNMVVGLVLQKENQETPHFDD